AANHHPGKHTFCVELERMSLLFQAIRANATVRFNRTVAMTNSTMSLIDRHQQDPQKGHQERPGGSEPTCRSTSRYCSSNCSLRWACRSRTSSAVGPVPEPSNLPTTPGLGIVAM